MEFGCHSKIQSLKSYVAKPLEAQIEINIFSNIYNYIFFHQQQNALIVQGACGYKNFQQYVFKHRYWLLRECPSYQCPLFKVVPVTFI